MTLWYAILLGLIQGLTEFLPVSSSGHLVIVQSLITGFQQPGVVFDVMLHLGTLLAVLVFLRKEILHIIMSILPVGWRRHFKQDCDDTQVLTGRKMALYIVTGTIFTGIIGLSFEEKIHHLFTSATTVSFMLLITGALLFISDRFQGKRVEQDMNILDSVVIGFVQGISLIPGISRSGSTIAFGIFRGLDGQTAARFSFLLSIPAILGAVVFESKYMGMIPPGDIAAYLAGMIAAAITGFLTLRVLLFIIRKHRLRIFAWYCWTIGISTLIIRIFVTV
ncbi:MAG: undecaprenyl-diphosphate phosphatase [Thermodesulfobacteriota bacterium]|nr:undecaprenyl-diphosphate phosphatase [Thermodesulfobacteriota bacterium]